MKIGTTFVPNPCFREQTACTLRFENANGEVYVFAEAHLGEPSEVHIHIAPAAHIERTRIEFVEFFLAAPYASCGKKRCHGVGDGLLSIGKRGMCTVWTAECVCRLPCQFVVYRLHVTLGQHHIAV